jgi:O-antigen/teichoic acid export membrane protein
MLVTLRGFAVRAIGFASNLFVVRFVSPEEFGVFAIGLGFITAGTVLTDAGMAAALVREKREPERRDLAAVQGFQLLVSLSIVALVLAGGSFFGSHGLVVALMACSLPITTLRVPAVALFERKLDYGPLVRMEVVQTLAYALFLVIGLLIVPSVWVLAAAVVFRSVVGTVVVAHASSVGLVAPVADRDRLRPIWRFGAQFSGINALAAGNEQALNFGVTAIAGLAVLGVWGVAFRILQLPQIVFQSLRRVSYPAMARLIDTGEDMRPTIERTIRLGAVAAGVVLVPVAAAAPGYVPLIFGDQWAGAADALPGACLGLMIGGPVSLAVAAYVLATGAGGQVLRAAIARVTVMLGVSLPLLSTLDVAAIGVGYLAGSATEAVLLGTAARRLSGARLWRALLPTVVAAVVSGAAGHLITTLPETAEIPATLGGAAAAVLSFLVLTWFAERSAVGDLVRLAGRPFSERLARPRTG